MPFKWNLCIFQFRLKEVGTSQHKFFLKCLKFTESFASNVGTSQHKHAKKLREVQYRKKAFMIELTLICMGMSYVHRLMNDQDTTWMSKVSGLRKELLPSLLKAQPTQSLGESPAPRLLVSWSELAPLRPEDFELILASCLCVVGSGLLPGSCSCTLFTGPAVCCVVVCRIKKKIVHHIIYWYILNSKWTSSLCHIHGSRNVDFVEF